LSPKNNVWVASNNEKSHWSLFKEESAPDFRPEGVKTRRQNRQAGFPAADRYHK
jgi:hypothetical protein